MLKVGAGLVDWSAWCSYSINAVAGLLRADAIICPLFQELLPLASADGVLDAWHGSAYMASRVFQEVNRILQEWEKSPGKALRCCATAF